MWEDQMQDVINNYILSSFTVMDLEFSSQHRVEVFMAMTTQQKTQGLSLMDTVDKGMLFYYETPTYIPFTMKDTRVDLDIGHYDAAGKLIQSASYEAHSDTLITSPRAFSFVLEMPKGHLPSGNFRFL